MTAQFNEGEGDIFEEQSEDSPPLPSVRYICGVLGQLFTEPGGEG
jgi:hypothetical protein